MPKQPKNFTKEEEIKPLLQQQCSEIDGWYRCFLLLPVKLNGTQKIMAEAAVGTKSLRAMFAAALAAPDKIIVATNNPQILFLRTSWRNYERNKINIASRSDGWCCWLWDSLSPFKVTRNLSSTLPTAALQWLKLPPYLKTLNIYLKLFFSESHLPSLYCLFLRQAA